MHTSDDTPTDRTRRLEKIAHRIWVEEGRPHGRDRAHWAAAEAELEALEAANRRRLAAAKTAETKAVGAGTRRTKGGTDAAPTPTVDGPKKAGTKPATRSRTRRPAGDA
ncbi:MAG: hypothetical protein CMO30_26180 [Tistrella sp.]|uniref:DUF2934 domain-containing protein n=1 Tax=Tistrella mobilis TaxID=171437 RepID=A0A3B9IJE3_9PROT|nr:DUF2934 domain-containing protein [Tistrella sp.]MAD36280.1 hypothetical protein [Tistrella sp.]MBA78768.1 hypothetical protein [Tistrella sp.]HAE47443.1 hypothetical protein [Tistrella mobilis]